MTVMGTSGLWDAHSDNWLFSGETVVGRRAGFP